MSCIKDEILNEASVDLIDKYSVISSGDTFKVRQCCLLVVVLLCSFFTLHCRNLTLVK